MSFPPSLLRSLAFFLLFLPLLFLSFSLYSPLPSRPRDGGKSFPALDSPGGTRRACTKGGLPSTREVCGFPARTISLCGSQRPTIRRQRRQQRTRRRCHVYCDSVAVRSIRTCVSGYTSIIFNRALLRRLLRLPNASQ